MFSGRKLSPLLTWGEPLQMGKSSRAKIAQEASWTTQNVRARTFRMDRACCFLHGGLPLVAGEPPQQPATSSRRLSSSRNPSAGRTTRHRPEAKGCTGSRASHSLTDERPCQPCGPNRLRGSTGIGLPGHFPGIVGRQARFANPIRPAGFSKKGKPPAHRRIGRRHEGAIAARRTWLQQLRGQRWRSGALATGQPHVVGQITAVGSRL